MQQRSSVSANEGEVRFVRRSILVINLEGGGLFRTARNEVILGKFFSNKESILGVRLRSF